VPGCGPQEMRILLLEGNLKLKDAYSKVDINTLLFSAGADAGCSKCYGHACEKGGWAQGEVFTVRPTPFAIKTVY